MAPVEQKNGLTVEIFTPDLKWFVALFVFFVCILKIKSKQKAIGTQSNNTCSSIYWLELDAKLWIFFDWGVFLMFAKHILGVFDAIGMPILGVFPWKVATLSNTKNRKIMDSTIIRYTKLFFLKDWLH